MKHDRLKESLSAVLDGQASELELRRVLAQLDQDQDPALREQARRYQRVGETLRGQEPLISALDISASVREAIAEEAPLKLADAKPRSPYLHALSRVAVAASVAAIALFGIKLNNDVLSEAQYAVVPPESESLAANSSSAVAALAAGAPVVVPTQRNYYETLKPLQNTLGASGRRVGVAELEPDEVLREIKQQADAMSRQRLRAYMFQHAENASLDHFQGVLPFARFVNEE